MAGRCRAKSSNLVFELTDALLVQHALSVRRGIPRPRSNERSDGPCDTDDRKKGDQYDDAGLHTGGSLCRERAQRLPVVSAG
jgi:hypothetical protein